MSDRAGPFDWSGGHPALDLVNTLDERPFPAPIETLATYADLVRFAELAKLIDPSVAQRLRKLTGPACSRVANQARKLREHLHDVLAAAHSGRPMPQTDLEAIGRAIQAAHSARALVLSTTPGLATHRWSQPIGARGSAARLCAFDRAPACRRRPQPNPGMWRARLCCLLRRHEQRASPAVVQHEELREP